MPRQGGFVEPTLQRFRVDDTIELEIHADNTAFFVIDDERSGEVHYRVPIDTGPLWRMLANRLDMQISGAS